MKDSFKNFITKHPFFFLSTGYTAINLVGRYGTKLIKNYTDGYFKTHPDSIFNISPSITEIVKNMFDEAFNQVFYKVTLYNSPKAWYGKALGSASANTLMIFGEMLVNDGLKLFQLSAHKNTLPSITKHLVGQSAKFFYLNNIKKPDFSDIYMGATLLYGFRTGLDKFFLTKNKAKYEELTKLILKAAEKTPKYTIDEEYCYFLQGNNFKLDLLNLKETLKNYKAELTPRVDIPIDLTEVLEKLKSLFKADFGDSSSEQFINYVFNQSFKNIPILENNWLNLNVYHTATDMFIVGPANNIAFSMFNSTQEPYKTLLGSATRAIEAAVRYGQAKIFEDYIKTDYVFDYIVTDHSTIASLEANQPHCTLTNDFSYTHFPASNSSNISDLSNQFCGFNTFLHDSAFSHNTCSVEAA